MDMIHTHPNRDACYARAWTLQTVRYLMMTRLSEATREIPEVTELIEILKESEKGYWQDYREAERQLKPENSPTNKGHFAMPTHEDWWRTNPRHN